jgi:diketogulonate reductase-like aldo/keto reductase
MVLGWSPSQNVSVIPTSNQDVRQAKNRKKAGMKLKPNLL